MGFSQEGVFGVGQFVSVRTMHGSTRVDTLTVRTVANGVLTAQTHCKKILCVGVRCAVSGIRTERPLLLGETITAENCGNVLTGGTECTVLVVVERAAMQDRTVCRGLRPPSPPDLRHLTSFRGDFSKKENKAALPQPYPRQTNKQQSL